MARAEIEGGVIAHPVPVTAGAEVNIKYNGLLAASGADAVYLHYGYGPADHWADVADLPMHRTSDGFEASVKVKSNDRLNFCFKDSANNWDNNNGKDWSYTIHSGRKP